MSLKTPWKYDTAEEKSISVLIGTGGTGRIFFVNQNTGKGFSTVYSYGAVGAAKGAVANFAASVKATPSGALTHVYAMAPIVGVDKFGPDFFPCI
jgi:hypothetical protein